MKYIVFLFSLVLLFPLGTQAQVENQQQTGAAEQTYYRAQVLEAGELEQRETVQIQSLRVRIETGDISGTEIEFDNTIQSETEQWREVEQGDTIVVLRTRGVDSDVYFMTDIYRLPRLLIVLAVFFVLAMIFAGKRGSFAIGGMAFSVLILAGFIVPQIANGRSPLLIGGVGAILIAVISLYVAHGVNKRTTVALVSTLTALALAAILAAVAVNITSVHGAGSEEAYFLQFSFGNAIELRGLFLVGIIIGALGVLDDITTSLSATVEEIALANPNLPQTELYKRGLRVGVEHIASLINTLVLAYAGASLPLLLLFSLELQPFWVTVNSQFLSEEIIRTVVGSTALILAVPITTSIAAYTFSKKNNV